MIQKNEKLYFSVLEFSGLTDSQAFQAAVDAAQKSKVKVVVATAKPDGTPWKLDKPVVLPGYFTLILSGCTVECEGVAFINEHAENAKTLATECHKLFILGRKGAKIVSLGEQPQIQINNARDCRIAGLTFEGGAGIDLNHFQYSKLQMLTFLDCLHGVYFREGCNNIILESVDAETKEEAILARGGEHRILARDPEICNSILCRIRTKTQGAPAVALYAGLDRLFNIVVRDVTDETQAAGAAVVIGAEKDKGIIRDLTVRGVKCSRDAVHTNALCDGNFYSNLHPGQDGKALVAACANTREYLEEKEMEMVLPQFREELPDRSFVTATEERFFGTGDADTVQNAVNYAAKEKIGCVVIPAWNVRTQCDKWVFEKAVKVPSDMTIVFLHCYIQHQDFMYENLFISFEQL